MIFAKIPVVRVDATTLAVRYTNLAKSCVRAESIPLPDITPPKHIALRTSQIVLSIPSIPDVAINSLIVSLPESIEVEVEHVIINALNAEKCIRCDASRILGNDHIDVGTDVQHDAN